MTFKTGPAKGRTKGSFEFLILILSLRTHPKSQTGKIACEGFVHVPDFFFMVESHG